MNALARPPVVAVLAQHAEDCAALRNTRRVLVRAPHVKLRHLRRLDDRLAAHLDGLRVAGADGLALALQALAQPGAGETFAAGVLLLEAGDDKRLRNLLALAQSLPEAWRGFVSAIGWVSAPLLRERVRDWLRAQDAFARRLGIAACLAHRVDPGPMLAAAIADGDATLRAIALRAAGALGRTDLLAPCRAHLNDAAPSVRQAAAGAAVLLGERGEALALLCANAVAPGPAQDEALPLALLASDGAAARALLETLSKDRDQPQRLRVLLRAVGLAGDPRYIDWLIERMADDKTARLAGEAFSRITGADLAMLDLERKPPAAATPGDDAADADAALDEDESLPWPDAARVKTWWRENRLRFAGARLFEGEPPSRAHCRRVLAESNQRNRWLATLHEALAAPGTALFNVAAPAWRQQRKLQRAAPPA
jgi:uncharacterized protein (TIGR02270 family)